MEIFESLGKTKVVDGAGVVGKKPVLSPGEIHKYKSGCLINSVIGSMECAYIMIDFSTTKKLNVEIPAFKLCVPFILN